MWQSTVLRLLAVVAVGWSLWSSTSPVTSADGPTPIEHAATATSGATRLSPPARRVLLGFVGDIHVHRRVNTSAARPGGRYDYAPMFAQVRSTLQHIDVATCHLEQPFAPPGQPVMVEPPLLSSAPQLAAGLVSGGFDRCGTASNHAMDRDTIGVDVTLDTMDKVGLGHAGTARWPAEAQPSMFTVNGVRIAQLSYTFGSNRGTPPDQRWRVNVSNATAIVAAARSARSAGAELVVLTIEWGVDKYVQPTPDQTALAAAITASHDIDLIVGYQAHVIQPISLVNGTWVVWGMGNFLSDHPVDGSWPASSQDGAIFTFDVLVDAHGRAQVERPAVIPTWCDRTGGHVVLPTSRSSDPSLPAWKRQALAASRARTYAVVGAYFAPGT
jgi:poly-gamma-glutamate synthesis protein (capsule biosynthesis protein)